MLSAKTWCSVTGTLGRHAILAYPKWHGALPTMSTRVIAGRSIMTDEIRFQRGTTLVRRLRRAPGEAMPWHRDPYHRVTVILHGEALAIEYREGGEHERFEVVPGQVDWD